MNGTQEAPAGAPLAAHFEAKRRILATVKQMEERGEKLEEATLDEVLEAANKAEETVFKFDFSLSGDGQEEEANEKSDKKRSRNRKRNKKRRAKKPHDDKNADDTTTERSAPVTPAPQRGNAKNANANGANKQKKQENATNVKAKAARGGPSSTSSSFLKLRKATGTESEVAKMHLRYGQGRRNLTASKQREQRKKAANEHKKTDDFKFNFVDSS